MVAGRLVPLSPPYFLLAFPSTIQSPPKRRSIDLKGYKPYHEYPTELMEQRRTKRFKLQLPLSITRSGTERVTLAGFTQNISSSGVLFTAEREPDIGGPIEYVITLNHEGPQSVNLRCMGKVVRLDRLGPLGDPVNSGFQVAATLERYEFVRDRGMLGRG